MPDTTRITANGFTMNLNAPGDPQATGEATWVPGSVPAVSWFDPALPEIVADGEYQVIVNARFYLELPEPGTWAVQYGVPAGGAGVGPESIVAPPGTSHASPYVVPIDMTNVVGTAPFNVGGIGLPPPWILHFTADLQTPEYPGGVSTLTFADMATIVGFGSDGFLYVDIERIGAAVPCPPRPPWPYTEVASLLNAEVAALGARVKHRRIGGLSAAAPHFHL